VHTAPGERSGDVIKAFTRHAPVIVIALAAAGIAAGGAAGDPSIGAKQAEALRVESQIQALDSSLERARTAYESATFKLTGIQHNLKINKIGLHVARSNASSRSTPGATTSRRSQCCSGRRASTTS